MHESIFPDVLRRQTGLLVLGPEDSHSYQMFKSTLQKNKIPSVALTPDNFNQHIPHFNLTEGDGAVVDIKAGVLFADRALRTAQVELNFSPIFYSIYAVGQGEKFIFYSFVFYCRKICYLK